MKHGSKKEGKENKKKIKRRKENCKKGKMTAGNKRRPESMKSEKKE